MNSWRSTEARKLRRSRAVREIVQRGLGRAPYFYQLRSKQHRPRNLAARGPSTIAAARVPPSKYGDAGATR